MPTLPDAEEFERRYNRTWMRIIIAVVIAALGLAATLVAVYPGGPDAFWHLVGVLPKNVPDATQASDSRKDVPAQPKEDQSRLTARPRPKPDGPPRTIGAAKQSAPAERCKYIIVEPFHEPLSENAVANLFGVEAGQKEFTRLIQRREFKEGFIVAVKDLPSPPYRMVLLAQFQTPFDPTKKPPVEISRVSYGAGPLEFADASTYLLRRRYVIGDDLFVQPLEGRDLERVLDRYGFVLPACPLVEPGVS